MASPARGRCDSTPAGTPKADAPRASVPAAGVPTATGMSDREGRRSEAQTTFGTRRPLPCLEGDSRRTDSARRPGGDEGGHTKGDARTPWVRSHDPCRCESWPLALSQGESHAASAAPDLRLQRTGPPAWAISPLRIGKGLPRASKTVPPSRATCASNTRWCWRPTRFCCGPRSWPLRVGKSLPRAARSSSYSSEPAKRSTPPL
jgi:hypothetical protein